MSVIPLNIWVKQRVRDYPDKTFKTIRDEACKYSSDLGDNVKKKSRSCRDECEVESVSQDRIHGTINDEIRELEKGQAAGTAEATAGVVRSSY